MFRLVPCLILVAVVTAIVPIGQPIASALAPVDLATIIAGDICQEPTSVAHRCKECVDDFGDDSSSKCTVDPTDSGACAAFSGMPKKKCKTTAPFCGGVSEVYDGLQCATTPSYGVCTKKYSHASADGSEPGTCH